MSEETKVETPAPVGDVLDYYKSVRLDSREVDGAILDLAQREGVFTQSMRYDDFRGGYRGVIKGVDGEFYYFNAPAQGIFRIVKADDATKKWESEKLFKSCTRGVDIIHKGEKKDNDEEDGKAMGGSPSAELPPASQPEAQTLAEQQDQITQTHPGAGMGTTPESDGAAARWHGTPGLQRSLDADPSVAQNSWNTGKLLQAWGEQLQKSVPTVNKLDPSMRQFCIEVLGKTPDEVDRQPVHLNGLQRAQYNQWLTKSLRGRMSGLQGWLEKARK